MPKPNYAILRVARVKTVADLEGATRHGKRADTGTHFDTERTPLNLHWSACEVMNPIDWVDGVARAVKRLAATTRQGASVAAEFLVAASPEYFAPREGYAEPFNMGRVRRWADATMDAFYERYGEAVVAARLDLDEGSPHMAICIVPTYVKVTRNKQELVVSYRQVFSGDNRLEARQKMIELQDWYAGKMAHLGLERGLPAKVTRRGHLTHHQYARKKHQEDQDREKALLEARNHADRLRRALEDIGARATRQELAEASAVEWAGAAATALDEAKHLIAFLSQASTLLKAYDPNAPIVKVLEDKVPAMARAQATIERLSGAVEDMDEYNYPKAW